MRAAPLLFALAGCSVFDAISNEEAPGTSGGYRKEGVANAGGNPKQILAGNFDGTAGIDLAVLDTTLIMIYAPNAGGPPFNGQSINTLTFNFDLLATAELDGDPTTELVAVQTNTPNGQLRALDPRGPSIVDAKSEQSSGTQQWSSIIAVGDFLDLANDEVAIWVRETTTIALFRDLDTTPTRTDLTIGAANVVAMVAANVDTDAQDELVVVAGIEVTVYDINGSPPAITAKSRRLDVIGGIREVVVADLGSTTQDDIGYFKTAGGFGVLYSDGNMLEAGTEFTQLATPIGIGKRPFAAQVLSSSRLDLGGLFDTNIEVFANENNNDFREHIKIPVDGTPQMLFAGDLTGDGRTDFAYNSSLGGLTLLIAD